ncbi:MAG: LptA/OstA family protein [Candidatus Methylacidiphilales bacterium]|nr:LptA/OstA family protein [Candidatus Methylacidiphilales bacterium]
MNTHPLTRAAVPLLLLLGLLLPLPRLGAQNAAKPSLPAPASDVPAGTQVASDSFRLNLEKKEGVFSGNVKVADKSFNLESEELIVYFAADNKLERLVARGNVRIKAGPTRSSTSREAEYLVAEKKIKLTGDPVVMQNQNRVTGTVITMYPDSDRMDVDGRSKVTFFLE